MTTASEASRALRGTKRVCHECAVRFYDLARSPIVCPSCGTHHTPVAQAVFEPGARAPYATKTGWRSKAPRRPEPVVAEAEAPTEAAASADEPAEEAANVVLEDDTVLEQEADDGDVSGLLDHDVEEPKEP